MPEFSLELKTARMSVGVSQSVLARRIDVDPSYISRLESGERQPASRDFVRKLAKALRVGVEQENDLLFAAGFAPVTPKQLRREHPTLQLLADIFEDDHIPTTEKELIGELIKRIHRQWRDTDSPH